MKVRIIHQMTIKRVKFGKFVPDAKKIHLAIIQLDKNRNGH